MSSRQSKRKRKSKSSAVPFQSAVSLKKDEKEEDDNMLLKGNIAESDDEVEESSGDEFLDDSADEVEEKQDIESIFNGSAFGSDSERSSINGEDDDDANESSNSDSDEGDDTSDYTEDEEANLEDSGEDDDNEANNAQILQKEFRKKKGESTGDNSNGSDEPKLRSINTKDAIRKGDFERPENLAEQSDSSDDEGEKNRIGNVPLEWYDEFDHIGYDIKGQKIGRKAKGDALDDFLARSDPNFTRTIYDPLNDEKIVLNDEELNIINRVRHGKFPNKSFDPYQPHLPYYTNEKRVEMIGNAREPKRRFIPSKNEARMVVKLVNAIRNGWIKPYGYKEENKEPEVYMLWGDDDQTDDPRHRPPVAIPPPKPKLPGHAESYNPPGEYVPTQEEKNAWEMLDPEDRPFNFMPTKFKALRQVPLYDNLLKERFERCLDLYLCPRTRKKRLLIDPETLIPKLPKPQDLRPFPTSQTIEYLGHTGKVRSISVSPCGQWLCSGSDDGTVRVWEVDTGRCFKRWDLKKEIERMKQSDSEDSDDDDEERNMDNIVYCVAWNPNPRIPLIAAAVGTCVVMLHTQTGSSKEMDSIEEMILAQIKAPEIYATMTHDGKAALQKMKKVSDWEAEEKVDTISSTDPTADDENDRDDDQDDDDEKDSEGKSSHGFFSDEEEPEWSRMCIDLKKKCSTVVWHHKGDYFATVSSQATHSAVLIHRLSRRQSQSPFKKSKGLVQTVMFHPTKPFFFVASKRNIRIYDLTKQKLMKKLTSPAKWISSMVIHPSGDHVLAGSYDRRLSWYDLDLSNAPYKTLKYHKKAIRGVAFHRSYPLFASAADDGNLHIFHGKVYNDLLTNPLIVPVKILKAHKPVGDLGTLATVFHPTQPWIFSAGADKAIRLFTY